MAITCPSCGRAAPAGDARFCGGCGTPLPASADAVTSPAPAVRAAVPLARHAAVSGRFLPGTVVAGRYRMIGLLGRGGMGEVYRADDLKLGQPVALKFLPPDVERDTERLERFLTEVRVSLRVTHPNVCRVFDVGQIDERHFLSMEYVDGEDLASLLRRIGRLPEDKAVEISRQLCAGLTAAHDEGVLHRDLKPANIMLDGRGRAKITDFGLAGAVAGISGAEARAGTPQYMAPEQVAGGSLSERTDLYALGLVLYELFTGKRPFEIGSLDDLARQAGSTPTSPSSHVSGLNPLVERAILRCLERDPERRPVSAAALAAALPGGDPLAMAIAAGDTPSPEMVAAAGSDAGLRPTVARLLFGTALAGMAATALLAGNLSANGVAASGKPPVVLVERARELLRAAGFPERAQDSGWGFERNWAYLNWPAERRVAHGLDGQAAHAMVFWYRESPVLLERKNFAEPYLLSALWPFDPQLAYSGEVLLRLDREGRLRSLTAIPPQRPAAHDDRGQMDWAALFEAAGLDPTAWRSDEPAWTPVYYGDERVAWVPDGEATGDVIRVEGASFRGRPVHFALIHPWTVAERDAGTRRTAAQQMSDLAGILLLSGMMAAAVLIARRNLRLDRADRRGAVRLAAVAMALTAVAWLLAEHHIPSIWQLYLVISAAGWTLFCGTLVAAFYLALEPYVRRTWPATIISWSRAIAGATHDSLVARDVLIGCAAAAVVGLSEMSAAVVTQAATGLLPLVDVSPAPLLGLRHASSSILMTTVWCVFQAFFYLMLLLGLRKVLRAERAAILASALVMGGLASLATPAPAMTLPFLLLGEIALFTLLARVGVLATIAALFVLYTLVPFPSAWPPTAWHSGIGLMGIAVTAALAAAAFRFASSSRVRHVGTQPGSTR